MKITPQDGDCWPACLAYFFRVPFSEVAQLSCRVSPDDWYEKTQEWLNARGLTCLHVKKGDPQWPIYYPQDRMLAIAVGKRESDGAAHCIVVRIRSDPHRLWFENLHCPNGGLSKIDALCFFPERFQ